MSRLSCLSPSSGVIQTEVYRIAELSCLIKWKPWIWLMLNSITLSLGVYESPQEYVGVKREFWGSAQGQKAQEGTQRCVTKGPLP